MADQYADGAATAAAGGGGGGATAVTVASNYDLTERLDMEVELTPAAPSTGRRDQLRVDAAVPTGEVPLSSTTSASAPGTTSRLMSPGEFSDGESDNMDPAQGEGETERLAPRRVEPETVSLQCAWALGCFGGLMMVLVIVLASMVGVMQVRRVTAVDPVPVGLPYCSSGLASAEANRFTPTDRELRAKVFDALSSSEIEKVVRWMNNESGLNIQPVAASLAENYVTGIELFPLVKTDVLAHLDGNGPTPDRFARVFVNMGAAMPQDAREYKVGPVNSAGPVTKTLVRTIPFNSRKPDYIEWGLLESQVITPAVNQVQSILEESFGATYSPYTSPCGDDDHCLEWSDSAPRGNMTGDRKTWIKFSRGVQGGYEHVVEFSMRVQHEGSDASKWRVLAVVYNYQVFNSVEELKVAYHDGKVRKLVTKENAAAIASSNLKRRAVKPRGLETKPAPKVIYPAGPRFVVTGNHINYLGWSFQLVNRPSAGLQFWDVRFKEERLIYELSLQEAFASYGGLSPAQAASLYMDTYWDMGLEMFPLLPNIDCPENAVYLDLEYYAPGSASSRTTQTMRNAVCIFEHNTGVPLRRHYDANYLGSFSFAGGAPGVALIVRTVATVGNYDYIYDYSFYPNGVIETKMAASGYIQGAPFVAANKTRLDQFGDQNQQFGMGTIHDHMLCFKVDLDIGGTANSFQKTLVKTKEFTDLPGYPYPYPMKYLEHVTVADESSSAIKKLEPGYYAVVNTAAPNKWGVPRGYRVLLVGGMTSELADHSIMRNNEWAKYVMSVTQRHEEEAYATLPWDQTIPQYPLQRFTDFFNGESLVQEDLVLWASVGMTHIPNSEDVPITTTAGGYASMFLRPHNYFDEDASMDLTNSYYVTPSEAGQSGALHVVHEAQSAPACGVDATTFTYELNE